MSIDEEITMMARELQKYGLQLPAFSKIGGILANEMPVDEVALHAAILAINDSIEKRNLDSLLANLKLYDAHLYNVADEYLRFYHECMAQAKAIKSSVAKNKVCQPTSPSLLHRFGTALAIRSYDITYALSLFFQNTPWGVCKPLEAADLWLRLARDIEK